MYEKKLSPYFLAILTRKVSPLYIEEMGPLKINTVEIGRIVQLAGCLSYTWLTWL